MKENMVKTIGGFEYQFFMLPAMDSVKLLTRIFKVIAPIIGVASGSGDKKTPLLERKLDVSKIVEALQTSLEEKEVEYIIGKLFDQTICEGVGQLSDRAIVNEHFKGRIKDMFLVVWGALEAQYGDFLAGKPELSNLVAGKPAKKTQTQEG